MPGRIAKITVDPNTCIGSAICAFVAPGVFELDAEGVSTVVNPVGDTDAKILEAAEGCPVLAISLEDENGDRIFPPEDEAWKISCACGRLAVAARPLMGRTIPLPGRRARG